MSKLTKMITYTVIGAVFFLLFTSGLGLVNAIRPPQITSERTPADHQLDYQSLQIIADDGVELAAWFVPRQQDGEELESSTTIVLLHGYPADKGDIVPVTQHLAKDYNLLYFDFRYLGQSGGAYSTVGAQETDDLLVVLEYLSRERGQERFGLWGFSLGGAVALMAGPREPAVEAVVSTSAYSRLSAMAYEAYRLPGLRWPLGWLTVQYAKLFLGIDAREVAPIEAVRDYRKPVLVVHSRDDEVIPFSHAQEIRSALAGSERAEFYFPPGRHGALPWPEYQERVREFFERSLKNDD